MVTRRLPHPFTSNSPHLPELFSSKPTNMIPSIALVVTVLSLISCSRAATIHARQDGCTFVCPDKDVEGNDLSSLATDDGVISCSYFGDSFNWCTYDSVSHIPLSRCQLGLHCNPDQRSVVRRWRLPPACSSAMQHTSKPGFEASSGPSRGFR